MASARPGVAGRVEAHALAQRMIGAALDIEVRFVVASNEAIRIVPAKEGVRPGPSAKVVRPSVAD